MGKISDVMGRIRSSLYGRSVYLGIIGDRIARGGECRSVLMSALL